MVDSANTVAGTSNGAPIVPSTGNWFTDQLQSLTNVAGNALSSYGSFLEKYATAETVAAQKASKPVQEKPSNANTAGIFASPENTKKAIVYGVVIIGTIATVIYFVRK